MQGAYYQEAMANSYFDRGRALPWWSSWYLLLYTSVCWKECGVLGEWSGKAQPVCPDSTTCSICCLHPWAIFKVELPLKGNWLGKEPTWQHSRIFRESHPITLYPCSHRTTSSRWTYTRDVSTTGTAWWSRSAEPSCLHTRATRCFTADQYPTCRPNHQSRPSAGWLSCSSAEHQDKNST